MKHSNVTNLANRLAQKQEEDQRLIEEATRNALQQHVKSLQKLSDDALNTTRGAIKDHDYKLIQSLQNISQQTRRQEKMIREEIQEQTRLLLWILKIPAMALALICLLVCLATWLWTQHKITQAEIQIQQMTAQFCKTPAGQPYCRRQP